MLKIIKSRTIWLGIIFLFLLMSSGCSSNKGVGDEQIKQDFQNSYALKNYKNLKVKGIEIEKRQTKVEDNYDLIYVWGTAENDNVECKIGLEMRYELYNEAWELKDIAKYEDNKWEIKPLQEITKEQADSIMSKSYDNVSYISKSGSKEEKKINYTYKIIEKFEFVEKEQTIELSFSFHEGSGEWIDKTTILDSKEDWNINGTWTYNYSYDADGLYKEPMTIYASITINAYDGKTVNCSYNVKYDDGGTPGDWVNSGNFEVYKYSEEIGYGFGAEMPHEFLGSMIYTYGDNVRFSFHENRGVIFSSPMEAANNPRQMTKN